MRYIPVKRRYRDDRDYLLCDDPDSRRQHTCEYFIRVAASEVQVCKKAFVSIHGLTRERVEYLQGQIRPGRESQSVVRADMRGRHDNRPNRTPVAALERVDEHIRSFPRYVSHYARDDNVQREFLPSGLSVVKMYQLYSDNCVADGLEPVKESRYWQIFTEKFNLSFIQPRRDTCSRCDAFGRKVETQKKNGEDWEGTEADWTAHKKQQLMLHTKLWVQTSSNVLTSLMKFR